jgi:YVTN family beta-propeller protein
LKKKLAGGKTTSGFSRGRQIAAIATAVLVALAVLFSGTAILFISAGTVAAYSVDKTITAGTGPMGLCYNPNDNKVYVANGNFSALFGPRTSGKTISVINCVGDTLESTITVVNKGVVPAAVCYDPTNQKVYETNLLGGFVIPNFGQVGRLDGTPPTVTESPTSGLGAAFIIHNPNDDTLYFSNALNDVVVRMNPTTLAIVGSPIAVGRSPIGICYNPVNHKIYVACGGGQTPSNPDNRVFVINSDLTQDTPIVCGTGATGPVYDSVDNKIFVTNAGTTDVPNNTVSVIDPTTGTVTNTITVGSGPFGGGYNPTTNRIYVANTASSSVSVIDGATENVVETITDPGIANPLSLAVNPNTNKIYVGNFGTDTAPGNTVTIITDNLPPPNPTTTGLVPDSATAGGAGFPLTVNGTNFVDGVSEVRWDGVAKATTYVSATELTATISAPDIATAGTADVTVYNAGATIPESNAQTFTINAAPPPDPTTISINPTSKVAGQGAFPLTVNGTNFVAGSVVRWNGVAKTTTYVSGTQLTAAIPASDIAAAGTKPVTVYNAGAATPESNAQTFTINVPPVPTTASIDPTSKFAGQGAFTLTVNGTNFVDGVSVVRWNGVAKTTTYVSGTQLTAAIPASDIAAVGTKPVTVYNAGAATPESGPQTFTINAPPVPTTTSIDPASKFAGQGAFTLTVNGTNFVDGVSVVRWNGSAKTTTYVSGTQLTAAIPASDIAAVGTADVTVYNAGAATPESNAQPFTINKPQNPVINSIDPPGGPPGTQVTITGDNFGDTRGAGNSGKGASYVSFNGVAATEYASWSNTEIVCTVPQGAGTGPVVVVVNGVESNTDIIFTVSFPTWYLAEGTCAWGFSTYITIENPNSTAVTAKITYMNPQASSGGKSGKGRVLPQKQITLPALSQTTINPRDDLGYNTDFSTKVECVEGKTIAVDRTMTWTGPGAPSPEAHSSIGATSPSDTWYLPEGSTNWGFETWTLVQNPNATEANVTLTYMTEDAGPKVLNKKIPAFSRATYNMASDIGSHDSSIKVTSDIPVIAERSMYRNSRREGTCSIGATTPAADYFLAEGTTDWGFTTYVLVQNPNDAAANVTVTYMTGAGPQPQAPFSMPANSRKTIRVNDVVPSKDLSTQVHADKPIIAERAMYWGADKPLGEASHDSIGMDSPHMTFYLPDGQTTEGRETWTLVQNPNAEAVTVEISYLTPTGAGNKVFTDTVPANSRKTYSMAEGGINGRAAIMVTSTTAGKKIMVERAMYWNSRGAGTDTIGGYSD